MVATAQNLPAPPRADAEQRRQLARMCESRRTRTVAMNLPHRWHPSSVRHPRTGEVFTPDGAWQFTESMLQQGVEIEIIELDNPPGARGFVMLVPGYGEDRIYIKLQFGKTQVIGRSFHLSNERDRDR